MGSRIHNPLFAKAEFLECLSIAQKSPTSLFVSKGIVRSIDHRNPLVAQTRQMRHGQSRPFCMIDHNPRQRDRRIGIGDDRRQTLALQTSEPDRCHCHRNQESPVDQIASYRCYGPRSIRGTLERAQNEGVVCLQECLLDAT